MEVIRIPNTHILLHRFAGAILLHRFITPIYTGLLHRFITPIYYTGLLHRFITPVYYTGLLYVITQVYYTDLLHRFRKTHTFYYTGLLQKRCTLDLNKSDSLPKNTTSLHHFARKHTHAHAFYHTGFPIFSNNFKFSSGISKLPIFSDYPGWEADRSKKIGSLEIPQGNWKLLGNIGKTKEHWKLLGFPTHTFYYTGLLEQFYYAGLLHRFTLVYYTGLLHRFITPVY